MPLKEIYSAVLKFDENKVAELTKAEIQAGTAVQKILEKGLIAPLDEVGKKFSAGELFVPEMLMSAQAMKAGLEVVKPLLTESGSKPKGIIVVGTVKGDLHDIGKNLVAMMMEGAGFAVHDLGVDAAKEDFASAVKDYNADIVALSALLTTTMPAMEATISFLKEQGLEAKVIIGGAPVTQGFADKIGAQGYGKDAPAAVEMARALLKG